MRTDGALPIPGCESRPVARPARPNDHEATSPGPPMPPLPRHRLLHAPANATSVRRVDSASWPDGSLENPRLFEEIARRLAIASGKCASDSPGSAVTADVAARGCRRVMTSVAGGEFIYCRWSSSRTALLARARRHKKQSQKSFEAARPNEGAANAGPAGLPQLRRSG